MMEPGTRAERRETRADRATSNAEGRSLVSRLSFLVLIVAAACDPGTTRPDVTPLPEARVIEVIGTREAALQILDSALVADSFPIARIVPRDNWLETPWFDARTLRPTGSERLGADVVKLRGWAEPARQGDALLVVELVYRPMVDPSVPERWSERAVPPTDSVYARVGRILKGVHDAIGSHFDDPPAK